MDAFHNISQTTSRYLPKYAPALQARHRDTDGLKNLQEIFKQHAAHSASRIAPLANIAARRQCTSPQETPTKRQKLLTTLNPRDTKTQQSVKKFAASTGYEVVSGSTLHQVHVTVHEDPVDVQGPDEDAKIEKDDEDDDEIWYLGTSQLGQLRVANPSGFGIPPANTDTAPVSTSSKLKKKKQTKHKMDDKAEEAALHEKRKTDHEMARTTLYCENYPAIQMLHQYLNLPKAGSPNIDMSAELDFMHNEWQKTHPASFFHTHIFTVAEVTMHLEEWIGDVVKYLVDEHAQYQLALDTLTIQSMQVSFPKPSKVPGSQDILISRLAFLMVNETGQHTSHLSGDEHHHEMLGLLTLNRCAAIYHWQVNNVSGCYWPFCNYVESTT